MIALLGKKEMFALFFGLWLVCLFGFPFYVMGRLCPVVVALPGLPLYLF